MRNLILLVLLGLGVLALVTLKRSSAPALLDEPLQVKEVDLGISPGVTPEAHSRLTCFYFPQFMVKEVDTSSKGAEQISILPIEASKIPECQRANVPEELLIGWEDWSGYVAGVKSHYLFLDGDDGFGLLFPFAVFDLRTGKKLFDDAIPLNQDFQLIEASRSALTLHYTRVAQLQCSIYPADAGWQACWQQAQRDLHLPMPLPSCATAYLRDAHGDPEDPSQLAYDVEAVWDGREYRLTPTGDSATCAVTP